MPLTVTSMSGTKKSAAMMQMNTMATMSANKLMSMSGE